jgi:hypothetical protein
MQRPTEQNRDPRNKSTYLQPSDFQHHQELKSGEKSL